MFWQPLLLSLRVAMAATWIVFICGLPLATWLARSRSPSKILVETLVSLPLILPPSVLGYYLLILLSRNGPLSILGLRITFTWYAAVIAAAVVALPLMVQSSRAAIEAVDPLLEQASETLGASSLRTFFEVTFPLARHGIVAGIVLAFARSLGEFGATLMIAGNIPGLTQTAPLAIYDLVQANRMPEANQLVLIMTLFAFALLFSVRWLERRSLF